MVGRQSTRDDFRAKHEKWPEQDKPEWDPTRQSPDTREIDDYPLREGDLEKSIPSLPDWPDDDDQQKDDS
jgi:hypothetical protein